MKIAGCQPDSGHPTVRDERGAYGNVSYGGMRNPLHKLKRCMSETLCLRLRAPYFYPTNQRELSIVVLSGRRVLRCRPSGQNEVGKTRFESG